MLIPEEFAISFQASSYCTDKCMNCSNALEVMESKLVG